MADLVTRSNNLLLVATLASLNFPWEIAVVLPLTAIWPERQPDNLLCAASQLTFMGPWDIIFAAPRQRNPIRLPVR